MDLVAVKRRVPAWYADMLDWQDEQKRGYTVIKAVPKRKLSRKAFTTILKVFRGLGGKYVSPGYFELVLRERNDSTNFLREKNSAKDIHDKIGNQLAKLTKTARQLVAGEASP